MIQKIYRNGYWFQRDPERPMVRFLGGGGPKPKLPPVAAPAPIPTPEDIDLQAARKGEAERKRARSRFGRAGTILTESTLGSTTQAKSPILGTVGA